MVQFVMNSLLGIRQVVRHVVLVHAFGGSNPSSPATHRPDFLVGFLRGWLELFEYPSEAFGVKSARGALQGNLPLKAVLS